MISIKRSLTELERLQELSASVQRAYQNAIVATRDNWPPMGEAHDRKFREQLGLLVSQLQGEQEAQFYEGYSERLRSILNQSRHQAVAYIQKLREELESTSQALEEIVGSVTTQSNKNEDALKRELGRLEAACQLDDLEALRREVRAAAKHFSDHLDKMRKANELTVAMLRDEIRSLQNQLASQPAKGQSVSPFATSPQAFMEILGRQIASQRPVSLAVFHLPALEQLSRAGETRTCGWIAGEFLKRLIQCLPPQSTPLQRSAGGFLVILPVDKTAAIQMLKSATSFLSAPLPGLNESQTRIAGLDVRTGVLNYRPAEAADEFIQRGYQLLSNLAAA